MGTRWASILAPAVAIAAACTGIAGAYAPTIVELVSPPIEVNGGFKPTRLPKSKLAPIHFKVEGTVNAAGDGRLPQLEQLILETGKNVAIAARGLPSCRSGKIIGPDIVPPPEGGCMAARIGGGEMEFEVELPEADPFTTRSHVIAINGGVVDGVGTIFLYAGIWKPVPQPIIIEIKITKNGSGSYGDRWTAMVPVIAGGYGSVKNFHLDFFRQFAYRHKRRSYLLARCPSGKIQAHWEAEFADSSNDSAGSFARPCTQKG